MKYNNIKCTLYSLGHGVYLADQIQNVELDGVLDSLSDSLKDQGFDVVEVIPNRGHANQAFVVTRHGRPPCAMEKKQISDSVLSDMDAALMRRGNHYLSRRVIMIKRDLGLVCSTALPPGIQVRQVMPLVAGLPGGIKVEVQPRGWIHNKDPKGFDK